MSTHNICFGGEMSKYYVDTPSYLELSKGKKKKKILPESRVRQDSC